MTEDESTGEEVMAAPQSAEHEGSGDDSPRTSDVNDGPDDDGSASDSESTASDEHSQDESDNNPNEADEKDPNGLSSYERMRLERIKRNQERLASLGLTEKNIPRPKKNTPKPRKKVSMDLPTRELPSRAGRATFMESFTKQRKEKEEEKNPDACFSCQVEGGELMCCDYCRTLYHPKCHPEITSSEVEGFRCLECEAAGKTRRVACGFCDACKREHDCETCVVCVNNLNDGKGKAKCIFRRCQSWGKVVLDKDEGSEDGEDGDHHDSHCDKCKDGGDLICCDECTKAFHSNCHKPKIYSLPEGHWTCMYCTVKPTREKKPAYKPKYGEPLQAIVDDKEWTVNVKWPMLNCNVCEAQEITGYLINTEWTSCGACGDSYHLKCLDPPLEKRPTTWRCSTCKEKKRAIKENRLKEKTFPKPKNEQLFEGVHQDDCYICINGGDLVCCDYCPKVFHMQCHIPPLLAIPSGIWKCCECAALEYKRMMRCGECKACLRDDCGKCTMCLDKPKFGGPGRLKQSCERKKCNYMRLAPPASRKSITDEEIKEKFKHAKTRGERDEPRSEKHLRKRKEPSLSVEHTKILPPTKKLKRDKKNSLDASAKMVHNKPLVKAKKISSLDMIDTSLANDPVGSKVRTLISTALKKLDNPSVQKHACQYIRVFIKTDKSANSVMRLGALLMLTKMMYEHNDDVSVQIEALLTLTKLVVKNQACGEAVIGSGCVALAIETMNNHVGSLEVLQAACALFRALSYDFRTHQFITSAKGVDAVVSILKLNSSRLDILLDGCCFLQNILCNPNTSTEAGNLFQSHGLTLVIADGIASIPKAAYIRVACGILANLAMTSNSINEAYVGKICITRILSIMALDVDVDTKKAAVDALQAISIGSSKMASIVSEQDGMKKMLELIKPQQNDAYLIMSGLKLIIGVMKDEKCAQLFVAEDGYRALTHQMNRYYDSLFVQASGCSILRKLEIPAIGDECAGDATKLILSALGRFSDGDIIQFDGRHALLNLLSQYPSVASILTDIRKMNKSLTAEDEEDGLDAASEVSDMEIVPSATDNLVVEDFTVNGNDDPVCHKIKTIISKSSNHLDDNKIQDKSIEQLRKLIRDDDDESAEKIIQLGGITMIVNAMKAHPDKAVVQAEACATLADLIWKYPNSVRKIAEAGCFPLVVKALSTHLTNKHSKLQQMGCGVFYALSCENSNHYFINGVNGLEAVLESMYHNSHKVEVMKQVCPFLQNMLSNPSFAPELISLILSKDTIPIIFDMMKTSRDVELLENACGAIKNLALAPAARSAIGKHDDSVETILSILSLDLDIAVSKGALDALKVLVSDESIRAQMKQDNRMDTVIAFVTNNTSDSAIVENGLNLLLEFAKSGSVITEAGVFELVTSEMSKNADNTVIQLAGCHILGNLLLRNEDEAGVAVGSILTTSMKSHYDDDEIQSGGLCALLNICSDHPSAAPLLRTREHWTILCKSELKIED